MDQLFMDLEKLTSISEQEDYLHIASENGDKIIRTGIFTNIIKEAIIGATPSYYARGSLFTPAKTTITIHADTQVNINGKGYSNAADVVLNTSEVAQAGKDVYIYACVPESGNEPEFVLSRNSTVPDGYDADNSRKIGGFHCLCADVGIISGHPLSGYVAGDILPASVWDLKHRPVSEPEGMVYVEGLGKWYDIYLASWDGAKLVSAYGGTIADGASARKYHGLKFNEDFGRIGKHLPSWDEFMVFAKGSNEQTSISGAADPGTTGGHRDTAGRRMISNDGLEDCCGALWQWMHDSFDVTSTNSNAAYTAGNRYINHNVFTSTEKDSLGNAQANTNWHIEPVYEPNVDERSYGWAYSALLVRLLAGGNWGYASLCGSRSAFAVLFGAYVSADLGGRGASEPRAAA